MKEKCFVKYCRNEPMQQVNGRLVCDKHIGDAFIAAGSDGFGRSDDKHKG